MGVFDFLFGKSGQSGQLDPETKRARDFLLNQMLMQYSAGPVNVPQYMAVAPQAQYSGTNALLSSLGLETVAPPSMPTTTVGGMEVYTSQPFQEQMESSYAERYPGQYDYLRSFYMDPVTGEFGSRSYGYADPMGTQSVAPTSGGGDGGYMPPSATDVGLTSYGTVPLTSRDEGSSYNERFLENLEAAERDAEKNPYGTTQGVPIYDQGYVGLGTNPVSDFVGNIINKGIGGSIFSATTGDTLLPTVDDLMAPTVDLSGYNPKPTIAADPRARGSTTFTPKRSDSSVAEISFGSDLSRSLSDPSYDPPGTVVSRALDRMFGRG